MEDIDVSASNGVDERSRGAEGDSGGPLRVLQLRVDVDAHVGHTAADFLQALRQFLWKRVVIVVLRMENHQHNLHMTHWIISSKHRIFNLFNCIHA